MFCFCSVYTWILCVIISSSNRLFWLVRWLCASKCCVQFSSVLVIFYFISLYRTYDFWNTLSESNVPSVLWFYCFFRKKCVIAIKWYGAICWGFCWWSHLIFLELLNFFLHWIFLSFECLTICKSAFTELLLNWAVVGCFSITADDPFKNPAIAQHKSR